jgi:hypothetical protein
MGGSWQLFEGLPPTGRPSAPDTAEDLRLDWCGFDHHGFSWAGVTTSDASAKAERLGWRVITRRQAAVLFTELGYYIPDRDQPDSRRYWSSALWKDQCDDLTWHVPERIDGHRFTSDRHVFVSRGAPKPLLAEAASPSAPQSLHGDITLRLPTTQRSALSA